MRPKTRPLRSTRPSFIEAARRQQIVETAIATIAARGLEGASLADIAQDAGISKGVISYHFAGRAALIQAILDEILAQSHTYIMDRVARRRRAADKLAEYIRASFDFIGTHRPNFVTWLNLWGSLRSPEQRTRYNARLYEPCRMAIATILSAGQRNKEFKPFPARELSVVIQGAIDGIMLQWILDPAGIDLRAASRRLRALFDWQTRAA